MKLSHSSTLLALLIVLAGITGCSSHESDWKSATQENSAKAYENYLRKHPESEFSHEARQRLETLTWENVLGMGTAEGYQKFLAEYPSSKYALTASLNLEMVESFLVKVVRKGGIPAASCGVSEAVVIDVEARRPGASATFGPDLIQAQQVTGEWFPLQRFVILQHRNVQMEDVAIRACIEDPDGLRFGGTTSDVKGEGYWAFFPDSTYFIDEELQQQTIKRFRSNHVLILFGSRALVSFREESLFDDGGTAVKRSEGYVRVKFEKGGTMRTMLMFPWLNSRDGPASQVVTVRAFGHVIRLTPQEVESPR